MATRQFGFVMAYHLTSFKECDKRPDPDPPDADPFNPDPDPSKHLPAKGEALKMPQSGILKNERTGKIDTAALIASAGKRVKVPTKSLESILTALLDSDTVAREAACYEPHHVIISYDQNGEPLGIIEICFSCVAFRIYPGGFLIRTDNYDIVEVARVLTELGLPLDEKNTSLKEYEKSKASPKKEKE